MNYKIKQVIKESKIISFCASLNKNLLIYFYNSRTRKLFIKFNNFFKYNILKKKDKSSIAKIATNLFKSITQKDIGLFIVLVVIFNTLAMATLKKEIDIFSISARIFFFCLGAFLIFKKKQ